MFTVIIGLSNLISKKILIIKIKRKYYLIFAIIFFIIIIIIWNIALKITEPLILFNDVNIQDETLQNVNNIQPNTRYKFEFDIESETAYTNEEIYIIEICERNKYDDIIKKHQINFGDFKGIKTIEFDTSEYTQRILIKYKTSNRIAQRGLVINELKINGQDVVLKYKYLPTSLVEKIQDIKLSTISVTQRTVYIKDTCKLIIKYGFLGIGADGWKYRVSEVQDYCYFANEPHSYILEVFCEFGIIGFMALILIIFQVVKSMINITKTGSTVQKSIILSVIVLLIHSCMDFELSFMYLLIILFTLIAIVETKKFENKCINVATSIILLILISVSLYFEIKICFNLYIKNEENPYSEEILINQINNENFDETIEKIIKRSKYTLHTDQFYKIITRNKLDIDKYIKLYNISKNEKELLNNDIQERLKRINYNYVLLNYLKENSVIFYECKNEILSEIEETEKLLEELEKTRLSFEETENYKKDLDEIRIKLQKGEVDEIYY